MNKKKQRKVDLILVIFFCTFIGCIGVLFILLPKKSFSSLEKRVLAQMPVFSIQKEFNIQRESKISEEFDTYLSDQFVGRNIFVGINSYYELLTGRNGLHDVFAGKDGYLFEKNTAITDENQQYMDNRINTLITFAKTTGIKPELFIVPSTGYIFPTLLPIQAPPYLDEQIIKTITNKLGDSVNFIDLATTLKEKSVSGQIFYRTDHHWTSYGAFAAYNQYCLTKGLSPIGEEAFTKTKVEGFYGTTYSRSALWLTKPDTLELWQGPSPLKITIMDNGKENNSPFFPSYLSQPDKYPVFLDGNHGLVKISNPSSTGGKLLLIKDSFGNCIAPFLAQNYSEVYVIDLRAYKKMDIAEMVKKENISNILITYCIDQFVNDSNGIWLK